MNNKEYQKQYRSQKKNRLRNAENAKRKYLFQNAVTKETFYKKDIEYIREVNMEIVVLYDI